MTDQDSIASDVSGSLKSWSAARDIIGKNRALLEDFVHMLDEPAQLGRYVKHQAQEHIGDSAVDGKGGTQTTTGDVESHKDSIETENSVERHKPNSQDIEGEAEQHRDSANNSSRRRSGAHVAGTKADPHIVGADGSSRRRSSTKVPEAGPEPHRDRERRRSRKRICTAEDCALDFPHAEHIDRRRARSIKQPSQESESTESDAGSKQGDTDGRRGAQSVYSGMPTSASIYNSRRGHDSEPRRRRRTSREEPEVEQNIHSNIDTDISTSSDLENVADLQEVLRIMGHGTELGTENPPPDIQLQRLRLQLEELEMRDDFLDLDESIPRVPEVPSYPVGELRYTECQICLEYRELHLRACCSYPCCSDCLEQYLRTQVLQANVRIQCLSYFCDKYLHRDEILHHLQGDVKEKYYRFLVDANRDPHVKTCPRCSSIHRVDRADLPAKPRSKSFTLVVTCPECALEWCFPCQAPAHPKLTCKEMMKGDKLLKTWAKEHHFGQANAQKCPKCKVFIQRSSGCDHMTCTKCRTDFCYRCGDRFIEVRFFGDHFSKLSVFGCKYRFLPNRPIQRKIIRGAVFGGKVAAAPVLAGFAVGVGAVLLGVGVLALPFYGSYKLHCHIKRKKYLKRERREQEAYREWRHTMEELRRTKGDPYLENWQRMRDLGVLMPFPLHGPPQTPPEEDDQHGVSSTIADIEVSIHYDESDSDSWEDFDSDFESFEDYKVPKPNAMLGRSDSDADAEKGLEKKPKCTASPAVATKMDKMDEIIPDPEQPSTSGENLRRPVEKRPSAPTVLHRQCYRTASTSSTRSAASVHSEPGAVGLRRCWIPATRTPSARSLDTRQQGPKGTVPTPTHGKHSRKSDCAWSSEVSSRDYSQPGSAKSSKGGSIKGKSSIKGRSTHAKTTDTHSKACDKKTPPTQNKTEKKDMDKSSVTEPASRARSGKRTIPSTAVDSDKISVISFDEAAETEKKKNSEKSASKPRRSLVDDGVGKESMLACEEITYNTYL